MRFKEFLIVDTILKGKKLVEMVNPLYRDNREILTLDKRIYRGESDKDKLVADISDIYSRQLPRLEHILDKFNSLMRTAIRGYNNAKFTSNLKPLKSVIDKTIARKKGFSELNDLVRGAILFDMKEDADEFVKRFLRRNHALVVGYEEKQKGDDNKYGYFGSHHLDLNIDGIIIEVQIMSKKLWQYKKAAHKIYTATRSKEGGADNFDLYTSKKIFSMANTRSYMREEFEEFENLEFTYEELENMNFEDFGED